MISYNNHVLSLPRIPKITTNNYRGVGTKTDKYNIAVQNPIITLWSDQNPLIPYF